MAARIIGLSVLGVVLFVLLLAGVYLIAGVRAPVRHVEMDVADRPSLWWADTRSVVSDTATEVSIVRVDRDTHEVVERRILRQIPNAAPDYPTQLDTAQDWAHETSRVANLGLIRR